VGELWLDGGVLVHHELPVARVEPSQARHPLGDRFAAYFAGDDVSFEDVEVDADGWTPFSRALCEALRAVPRGEVVTYGELAALAGRPGAARAAGTFCAGNRFPIVVPCHRVVSAGGLGSYGSLGLGYKRRLLELEGAALD
jgi:methylated-DNA-[protein]-cysteine S-methyltransferase